MRLDRPPIHGEIAVDFLRKYEETPQTVVPDWAIGRTSNPQEVEISTETFIKFVGQIAGLIRGRLSSTICLDTNGINRLKMNILGLAKDFARSEASGHPRNLSPKDTAPIIREIASGHRIKCDNCLTSSRICRLRKEGSAPLEGVQKKAGHSGLQF